MATPVHREEIGFDSMGMVRMSTNLGLEARIHGGEGKDWDGDQKLYQRVSSYVWALFADSIRIKFGFVWFCCLGKEFYLSLWVQAADGWKPLGWPSFGDKCHYSRN